MALSAATIPPHEYDPMTPSAARRISPSSPRRRRRNAAGGSASVASSATARALAAALWRLRHSAARRQDAPLQPSIDKPRARTSDFGAGSRHSCRSHHGNGIEASVMEKATKWDRVGCQWQWQRQWQWHGVDEMGSLVAELHRARGRISELEEEKRSARKKLERFLARLAEEKASWKSRARCAAAALKEELWTERQHRRQLEAANGKLMKEAAAARQRCEAERKARELMEEACEELTKEVEEDQAEVEALRRECVAMREEMEEERRMLQMAEVWREERVQMKLSDARAVLEHKYAHLNRLHAEMESFLRRRRTHNAPDALALRLRTIMADAASSVRGAIAADYKSPHAPDDVDAVFDHFRRKNAPPPPPPAAVSASAAASSSSCASPATDLFLEKVVDAGDGASDGGCWDSASVQGGSCDPANGNSGSGVTDRGRRPSNFNTELIRRLWRSAISESRRKAAAAAAAEAPASSCTGRSTLVLHNDCSPSYSQRDTVIDSAQGVAAARTTTTTTTTKKKKKSLKEKLMEARMDDDRDSRVDKQHPSRPQGSSILNS